jgi:iron complex transport system ATP-binding protein
MPFCQNPFRFSPLNLRDPSDSDIIARQRDNKMQMKPKVAPLISMKHVTVMRGESIALNDVTLEIASGEHVCILGPNGCGKSTLIKTLTRECYPVSKEDASISILGRENWNIFELRPLLGIVTPDLLAACATDATGLDVVLSGFFSSTRIFPNHHPDRNLVRQAKVAMERLGVLHLMGRAVAEMSSGEAKRTLIARALVHNPRTLLFDEPSNALDIGAQIQLRETMRRLAKEGIGILLVTHHGAEIIPEIERVVLLRAGRVVADGAKGSILTGEKLSKLFGIAVDVIERDGFYDVVSRKD